MNFQNIKLLFAVIFLVTGILACSMPSPTPDAAEIVPVTGQEAQQPVATAASSPTTSATPTEVAIQHHMIPGDLPTERSNHAGDYDSSTSAGRKSSAGGDRFTFGRFERPFSANTMDTYYPNLDIVDTFVFQDETWIYGTIAIKEVNANNSSESKYALELDLDRDGKGDWLVIALTPSSTEWAVDGVRVFEDTNNDVGSLHAMYTDENATSDGFETLVFDQVTGDDPDAAWARISPSDPNTIELAVKRSVLDNPERYLINMWAGTSLLDPTLFDINDHFTHEQAGAADPGFELYYPIKEVSELDNSCRMAVGFQPTGQEPGLCETLIPKDHPDPSKPNEPPPPQQPPIIIF